MIVDRASNNSQEINRNCWKVVSSYIYLSDLIPNEGDDLWWIRCGKFEGIANYKSNKDPFVRTLIFPLFLSAAILAELDQRTGLHLNFLWQRIARHDDHEYSGLSVTTKMIRKFFKRFQISGDDHELVPFDTVIGAHWFIVSYLYDLLL